MKESRALTRARTAGGVLQVSPDEFRRLLAPDARDREAASLLRHPDLLEPIAAMHRDSLLYLLDAEQERTPITV